MSTVAIAYVKISNVCVTKAAEKEDRSNDILFKIWCGWIIDLPQMGMFTWCCWHSAKLSSFGTASDAQSAINEKEEPFNLCYYIRAFAGIYVLYHICMAYEH